MSAGFAPAAKGGSARLSQGHRYAPGMRPYTQVDVFSSGPVSGNPLGVVHDGEGLDDVTLASFSRWTNLSEVTYLYPPTSEGADYRVRIFAGTRELPFAGHPTLGSAFAWLNAGGQPATADEVVQECGAGLVRVRAEGDLMAFAAPPRTRTGRLSDEVLDMALGFLNLQIDDVIDHEWGVNGPDWAMLRLRDDTAVRAIRPGAAAALGFDVGVVGLAPAGSPFAYEVRAFIPEPSVVEDPVTGSLNAAAAQGNDRHTALRLYDAFASAEKTLTVNVGGHLGVPPSAAEASESFIVRHLFPRRH